MVLTAGGGGGGRASGLPADEMEANVRSTTTGLALAQVAADGCGCGCEAILGTVQARWPAPRGEACPPWVASRLLVAKEMMSCAAAPGQTDSVDDRGRDGTSSTACEACIVNGSPAVQSLRRWRLPPVLETLADGPAHQNALRNRGRGRQSTALTLMPAAESLIQAG